MFRDLDGDELAIGDDVTVLHSSRHSLVQGSHGSIAKFGTKLVHVTLTLARRELSDGDVLGFEPAELRKGHHGRPRHPHGTFGEMQESIVDYRNAAFDRLIKVATERHVITASQAKA